MFFRDTVQYRSRKK